MWEFPKTRGTVFWGAYNKDPTISGTLFGSPIFGNSHVAQCSERRLLHGFRPARLRRLHVPLRSCAVARPSLGGKKPKRHTCDIEFRVCKFCWCHCNVAASAYKRGINLKGQSVH